MLASSSRGAARSAASKLSPAIVELHGSPRTKALSRHSRSQQQRDASSAQAFRPVFPNRPMPSRTSDSERRVFQYTADVDFRSPSATKLAKYNMRIGRLADSGLTASAFLACRGMKEEGIKPDAMTYNYLMQACSQDGHYPEARAVFEDMLAVGIRPDRHIFHHMLHAARFEDSTAMWDILQLMDGLSIRPNESTYEPFILHYADGDNLEVALQYLSDMGHRGLSPTLKTAEGVIRCAGRLGFPRLALDLADAFEETSVRRLDAEVWVECLISSAEALYGEGVLRTWQKVVHELDVIPDEGCCIQVLHTVGRHGLSTLGLDVLRVLGRMNVVWQEHHFAPVIEAFTREKKVLEALEMLSLIRSYGIHPVTETAYPIFQTIQQDAGTVDEAWNFLEKIREQGKLVDVTALNVVIQASIGIGDLQRAIGTYKAASDLDVTPNVDTYNFLLSGCIMMEHRQLGDRLLADMKEANVKPDVRTYERLVVLCLTQPIYEDAFFYLEEMKGQGFLPPASVYEAIIRKCVEVGDTRYKLAMDEMLECGYEMSSQLKSFVSSGGSHDATPRPARTDAVVSSAS